jgi:S-adenosylmethionine:tRNA ribosyltransferase-isomerase
MGHIDYNFHLPKELLATEPVTPRDNSRLFVYDTTTDTIQLDYFHNLDKYLPNDSTLVLNRTKVAPSRITLQKTTGGKIVCLFLMNEVLENTKHIHVMVDRIISVGDPLFYAEPARAPKNIMTCKERHQDSIFVFELHISRNELIALLEKHGSMPIPLYLRHTELSESALHERYQTVYAQDYTDITRNLFSVAAPTAGLHFTQKVFDKLQKKSITRAEVVLEVGLGTFAPLSAEALEKGKLHTEWYQVPESSRDRILKTKSEGRKIIAVGTTVVRTLESYAKLSKNEQKLYDEYHATDIFIREGHEFSLVDCLVTNFHLPNSSLMMLVEAFLQYKGEKRSLKELYEIAIQEKFRFYSFGDSMLIL